MNNLKNNCIELTNNSVMKASIIINDALSKKSNKRSGIRLF